MRKNYIIEKHRSVLPRDIQQTKNIYRVYMQSNSILSALWDTLWIERHVHKKQEIRNPQDLIDHIELLHKQANVYIAKSSQDEIAALFKEQKQTQALFFGEEKQFTRTNSDRATIFITGNMVNVVHFSPADTQ